MPENSSRAVLITSWVWTTRSRLERSRCEDTKIRNADAIKRTAVGAITRADGRVLAAKSASLSGPLDTMPARREASRDQGRDCESRGIRAIGLSRFRDRGGAGRVTARGDSPQRLREVGGDLVEEALGGQP